MNARESKKRREADEQEFRLKVIGLIESQKGVIGAIARSLDKTQREVETLKEKITDLEKPDSPLFVSVLQ